MISLQHKLYNKSESRQNNMSMAQIQLLGNLGRDPEMNYTPDGTAVCKFSIAVSKVTGKGTDRHETTTWYNVVAWRNLAEMLSTHLKKGQQVFVQGDLNVRQYTTKDGREGTSLDVTVEKFQFVGRKEESAATAGRTASAPDDPLGEIDDHPF
jgi:single-strand DNA-binding protein